MVMWEYGVSDDATEYLVMEYTEKWSFETARFKVAFEVAPEDMNPRDSFEFPEDIAFARKGGAHWFQAKVTVYTKDGDEIASNYLGGCSYNSFKEFYTSHRDTDTMNRNCSIMRAKNGDNVCICHYFPDMVKVAISEARTVISSKQSAFAGIHR